MVAACGQSRQDSLDMLVDKHHGDEDDVAFRDIAKTSLQRTGLICPVGGGMHDKFNAGRFNR